MQQAPLVSVIVPVYNAKNHLARCIESIRAQTVRDIEIILVNDGSNDNVSLPLCEMYARADSRILVVDKANAGVSDARNHGIELAAGTYLQFVDSDDYLAPDYTETLLCAAQTHKADLVIDHYYMVIPQPNAREKLRERDKDLLPLGDAPELPPEIRINGFLPAGVMDKGTFALHLMDEPASFYYGVMWNKLYRRELILQHNIRCQSQLQWKEGFLGLDLKGTRALSWSEDFLFNLHYIRYAECFVAINKPGYYYVQNPASLVHSAFRAEDAIPIKVMLFGYYCDLYKSLGLYEQNRLQLCKYLVDLSESTRPTGPLKKRLDADAAALRDTLCAEDSPQPLPTEENG
jgi:glycosyltransferase involved in cell wall biosynthesis